MTLNVEGLTVRYRTPGGDVMALADVSLAVAEQRTLAVIGESGSGKSTLALAILGLLPDAAHVAAGHVVFQGRDVLTLDRESRRKLRGAGMALVFQDPFSVLNPSLRVGAQIGEGLLAHRGLTRRAALARAIELLREVGIADARAVADAYPHELSGGMRQRALIAGALAAEPHLLILDEPTTALDITIEAQILDLLEELQTRRGLAMLFISHNLGVVRRIADEIAVLYAGQVVERGPTAEVLAQPLHPYAKGLVAAVPRLGAKRERLASIPGRLADLRDAIAGCRFQPRCPYAVEACGTAQPLRPVERRLLRCHRAGDLVGARWPTAVEQARRPRSALPRSDGPVVAASGLAKTFTLSRGLSAFALEGWRPRYRPTRIRAVDGVTLTIAAGEVVGLVGESGSGKSTLGRLILRLQDSDRGTVRIAGEDVTRQPQSALSAMRRTAQIVFQNVDSSLNPRKTVGQIVGRPLERFAILPSGEVPSRVTALLDLVRLPAHYAARYPHQLSGGEKQRVGIARALATDPAFIVCDEPVSALDVSVQAAIVNLLADLKDDLSVAYLFISHDISVVAHLADRIAVMYRGRIVEEGPAKDVTRQPRHPYTQALLSAVPTLEATAPARIGLPLEPRAGGDSKGCVFAGRCHRRVGDICDREEPPVRQLSLAHRAACHREA
ncbi:MAG TPA: ABC transporter ATP-binding protein [Hyphomicrobiaceae bacterium]|nr:ABC transporter ATP-binding protein [Hyphomicrobiaceae bacterium]